MGPIEWITSRVPRPSSIATYKVFNKPCKTRSQFPPFINYIRVASLVPHSPQPPPFLPEAFFDTRACSLAAALIKIFTRREKGKERGKKEEGAKKGRKEYKVRQTASYRVGLLHLSLLPRVHLKRGLAASAHGAAASE